MSTRTKVFALVTLLLGAASLVVLLARPNGALTSTLVVLGVAAAGASVTSAAQDGK